MKTHGKVVVEMIIDGLDWMHPDLQILMNPVGGSKVVSECVDVVLLALAFGSGLVLSIILSHGMDHTELVAIGRIIQVREQLGFS